MIPIEIRKERLAKFAKLGLAGLAVLVVSPVIFLVVKELKETTGMHPKWQAVDGANRGKWPYYELPVAAVAKASK